MRLSGIKMNDHSLQQKIFTVNITWCQPIYKLADMPILRDFSRVNSRTFFGFIQSQLPPYL